MEIPQRLQKYIQYIVNVGTAASTENFIEDFEPVGKVILDELKNNDFITINNGYITLNPLVKL